MSSKFVFFTLASLVEDQVAVNAQQVRYVTSFSDDIVRIHFDDNNTISVKGTLEFVVDKLAMAED